MALQTIPSYCAWRALGHVTSPYAAFGLVLAALAGVSFYTSISGLVKAELFPADVRALDVGLSYAIGNALFGGTAEYVALWFKSVGREESFFWYVTILCAVALLVAIWNAGSPTAWLSQGRLCTEELKGA